jgi:hypothetical protein
LTDDQPVVAPIPDWGHDPALITPQEQADENSTMATQEIKDLLLEAGPFARLSATEQRTRLVKYYEPWFTVGWKPDTVNNIRCTQRLVTHAKLMALPVGVVLQAILLEASGIEPGSRGLLGVPADTAPGCCVPDSDLISPGQQAEDQGNDLPWSGDLLEDPERAQEPVIDSPSPTPSGPKRRPNRAK